MDPKQKTESGQDPLKSGDDVVIRDKFIRNEMHYDYTTVGNSGKCACVPTIAVERDE